VVERRELTKKDKKQVLRSGRRGDLLRSELHVYGLEGCGYWTLPRFKCGSFDFPRAIGHRLGEGAVEVGVAAVDDDVLAGGVGGLRGRQEEDYDGCDLGVEGHAVA